MRFPSLSPSPSNRELEPEVEGFVGFPLGRGREENREEGLIEAAPDFDAEEESSSRSSFLSPSKKPAGREGLEDCLGWDRDWKREEDLGGGRDEEKDELLKVEVSESSDLGGLLIDDGGCAGGCW